MKALLIVLCILSLSHVYAQQVNADSALIESNLKIDSDPQDADVQLDGKFYGKTPLLLNSLPEGDHLIRIKKLPYEDKEYKVSFPIEGASQIFSIMSQKYALINVSANLMNAQVFVDDTLVGTTPIEKVKLSLGKHIIKVKKEDYFDWSVTVNAIPTLYNYKAVMKYLYGYVSLKPGAENSEIYFNNKRIDPTELNNYRMTAGEYDLEIRNEKFNKPITEKILIKSDSRNDMKIEHGYFTFWPLLQSLLVPGLGQYRDNAKPEGISIFSGIAVLGGVWALADRNYMTKITDYYGAQYKYSKVYSDEGIESARDELSKAYNTAITARRLKVISITALAAAYVYNLVDVLLFHSEGQKVTFTSHSDTMGSEASFNLGFNLAF